MGTQIIDLPKKLDELIEKAKGQQNVLEYEEIQDFLSGQALGAGEYEHVLDYLEAKGIHIGQKLPADDPVLLMEEEEIPDEPEAELSDGVSMDDPMRMYLKEIGKIPLLSSEDEMMLAKRMRQPGKNLQRRTCVWWSVLQKNMRAGACSFLI